jgi:CubicO group peptidase (beta-lactamase class C family)
MVALMRVLLVLILFATAAAGDDDVVVRGDAGKALDSAVERSTGGSFWGAVLVAQKGEILLAKGYGSADYAGRPNTARSLFEIASTSKPFTAAAVLKLHMQGKVDVDDPIAKYFKRVPDDKKAITIRQLLSHTSGISGNIGVPYNSPLTRAQYVPQMLGKPLDTEPGEKFAYCNVGYALLAALVEEVTGQTFEDYCRKHLFKPAKLVDTGFIKDKSLDGKRVTTRVHDLLRWDRALRGDTVLDAKTKAIYYAPVRDSYACGWRVGTTSKGATKVEHSGGVEGYACNYVRYLEGDTVIAVLSNGKSNIHEITKTIEDQLFPPPRITASVDVTGYELSRYRAAEFEGTAAWRVTKKGEIIHVILEDPKRQQAVATIRLPVGSAKKLRADLVANSRGDVAGAKKQMDAGAYLRPYTLRDGKLEINDGLQLIVMPRYVGRDENGKVVDERVTLVLMDSKRRQWPVMAKMDARTAKTLVAGLEDALE